MRVTSRLFYSRDGFMFDLHNHSLPDLDDGSSDWEESVAMARMAVEDGIEGIVCTPHWIRGYYENGRACTLAAVAAFKEKLESHRIPLQVYPGSEIRLEFDLFREIEAGEILTLNDMGSVLLVELPTEILPRNLEQLFYDLQLQGLQPVISHPERNGALQKDPMRLFELTEMGILSQVTAASLLGRFGEAVQRFTVLLLEHQMAHVIATDAHGLHMRSPRLSTACEEAARIVGPDMASQMVRETPWRLIQGEPVSIPYPIPMRRRTSKPSFWRNPLAFLAGRGKTLA